MGDWDSTRAWGCDYTSELIFTDADIQDSPRRPVYQTATCSAEKLDYSCSDGGGDGNLEWPLKYQLCLYLQSKLNSREGHCSYWLCMNMAVLHCLETHEEIRAHTHTQCIQHFLFFLNLIPITLKGSIYLFW